MSAAPALGPGGGRTVRQPAVRVPTLPVDLRSWLVGVTCAPPSQQNANTNQISFPSPQFGAVFILSFTDNFTQLPVGPI